MDRLEPVHSKFPARKTENPCQGPKDRLISNRSVKFNIFSPVEIKINSKSGIQGSLKTRTSPFGFHHIILKYNMIHL